MHKTVLRSHFPCNFKLATGLKSKRQNGDSLHACEESARKVENLLKLRNKWLVCFQKDKCSDYPQGFFQSPRRTSFDPGQHAHNAQPAHPFWRVFNLLHQKSYVTHRQTHTPAHLIPYIRTHTHKQLQHCKGQELQFDVAIVRTFSGKKAIVLFLIFHQIKETAVIFFCLVRWPDTLRLSVLQLVMWVSGSRRTCISREQQSSYRATLHQWSRLGFWT